MDRNTAKLIVDIAPELFALIVRGGDGTYIRIGQALGGIMIDLGRINHFMDILPTIKQFADGQNIQYYCVLNKCWFDIDTPTFQKGYNYRIKPEPREFIILVDDRGVVRDAGNVGALFPNSSEFETLKVREIQ